MRTAFDLCSECKHCKPLLHDDCEIRREFRIAASHHGVRLFTIGRCPEFERRDLGTDTHNYRKES